MDKYVELTAQVISDFVSGQHVNPADLPAAIEATYKALWECGNPTPKFEPEVQQKRRRRQPAERTIAPIATEEASYPNPVGPGGGPDDVTQGDQPTAQADSFGWTDDGQRIHPEPMFD